MRHYFLLLAVLVFSGALSAQPFQLSGTTKGMPDGTWLYLTLESGESAADSVQVKGNKFQLSGTLPLPLMNVFLHTAGLQQYKGFWMEPGLTTLVMESNALQEAKVTGSKVAADEAMLNKQLRQVLKRMEQIEATAEHEKNDAKRQQLISEYVALEKKQAGIQKQFIRQHPAS
ncbi:MAG: DUF4369 domain-containing protein, partial [Chitinophagaceae bacterium]|nr:DUF4369 domain-containing protein [Chitinophagaceae bacterium]